MMRYLRPSKPKFSQWRSLAYVRRRLEPEIGILHCWTGEKG